MDIIDFFDRAYVVNLPERTDRKAEMLQELKQANISCALDKVEIFPAIRPADAGEFPSVGAHGCFLSHVSILKQAQQKQLQRILVMEDDLAISSQLKSHQAALVDQLQQTDWGFVYFGHVEEVEPADPPTLKPCTTPLMTTHFYGINGKILDRLLTFLEVLQNRPAGHPDGGPMHLDGAYTTFRQQNPDIVTLIAHPNLGWQRSSRSDIYPNKFYDRLPGLKQLVGGARSVKQRLQRNQK